MVKIAATDARNKFGQVVKMAQAEPVHIQKNGRDVAVVLSPAHYASLTARNSEFTVRPIVNTLMARSIERRKSLYEALSK